MDLPDGDGDELLAALFVEPPESDDDGDIAAAIQNAVRPAPPAAETDGPGRLEDVAQHAKRRGAGRPQQTDELSLPQCGSSESNFLIFS